jgi:hypothetical protein
MQQHSGAGYHGESVERSGGEGPPASRAHEGGCGRAVQMNLRKY